MFAQVIQGRTSDAEGLRAALDRWLQDVRPGAIGWLGSTVGITDDGTFVALARFESVQGRRAQRRAAGAEPVVGGDSAGCSRTTSASATARTSPSSCRATPTGPASSR